MSPPPVVPPLAKRLTQLPPYLFVEIEHLKNRMIKKGVDVIDMGVGDPDQPTPRFILQAMVKALQDARHHQYPTVFGLESFRVAIAQWTQRRFGVTLDPDREILPLIGSKEGISHLPLAFVNPGDSVLVPDPCYPPYRTGTILSGGRPLLVPLRCSHGFLPDLAELSRLKKRAKLFFLNYPNNPTAAVADLGFFRELVQFAHRTGIPICHDAAYSEITFDRFRAPSLLQIPGAKEIGIEFHSLSKTFNMTGWRIGWVCGNKEMVAALAKVKSNIDSGIFQAVQMAGIRALQDPGHHVRRMVRIYKTRRDLMVQALQRAGWKVAPPKATFYLWAPIPKGHRSKEVATSLLQKEGIVATPGIGFGRSGEGYVRFSLSVPTVRLREAARRIARLSL